jgi:hypothetical protein
MKMDFKNMREFFSHNGMKNKKLSHFFQWNYDQGESKPYSRPFFPDFHFFVKVLILRELLPPVGDEFGETEGFFVQNMPIYNNLFQFFPRCHR